MEWQIYGVAGFRTRSVVFRCRLSCLGGVFVVARPLLFLSDAIVVVVVLVRMHNWEPVRR